MLPADRIDPASAPLDGREREILALAEPTLREGLALRRWWLERFGDPRGELTEQALGQILGSSPFEQTFRLTHPRTVWSENLSFGFFDRARIEGREVPIYGCFQQTFFDRPMLAQGEPLQDWRTSLRRFVDHHYIRSTNFVNRKRPFSEPRYRPLDRFLEPFSWYYPTEPSDHPSTPGKTVRLYYRRRDNGLLGKFRRGDESHLELNQVCSDGPYRWVVFRTQVDHKLEFGSLGSSYWPSLSLPRTQYVYCVLCNEFLSFREGDLPNRLLGSYGFTRAVGQSPKEPAGPQRGFKTIQFQLMDDGRILVYMIDVRARPQKLNRAASPLVWGLSLPWHSFQRSLRRIPYVDRWLTRTPAVDPNQAYILLANLLTANWAREGLGISRAQLERRQLTERAIRFDSGVDDVLYIWRAVPDWTDSASLPDWTKPHPGFCPSTPLG